MHHMPGRIETDRPAVHPARHRIHGRHRAAFWARSRTRWHPPAGALMAWRIASGDLGLALLPLPGHCLVGRRPRCAARRQEHRCRRFPLHDKGARDTPISIGRPRRRWFASQVTFVPGVGVPSSSRWPYGHRTQVRHGGGPGGRSVWMLGSPSSHALGGHRRGSGRAVSAR